MAELVQVTTAIDSEPRAQALADSLVQERLAACVQIVGPITSTYRWKGAVERATEWLCVIKTTAALAGRVQARVMALHSYEQPEVLVTPVIAADLAYARWVVESTDD